MQDPIQAQLRQAYQLIRAGDKPAALEILHPLCRQYPQNVDVWWLTANALSDPAQVRSALQKVLFIDPFHEQAQRRLDQLSTGARVTQTMQVDKPYTQEMKRTAKKQKTSLAGWNILALIALLLVIGVGGIVFLRQPEEASTVAPTVEIPTLMALPPTSIPVPTDTLTPVPPTLTPTATYTRTPLPATWTPIATRTTDPNQTTATSWIQPTRTLATANPAAFGDTYWEGNGAGATMDRFTRSDGRHLRYFELPVEVYVVGADTPEWEAAINHALAQIGQVVPVQRISIALDADLVVTILPREEFNTMTVCGDDNTELAGCAGLADLGSVVSDRFSHMYGEALIASDAANKEWVTLHELLHALGIVVHSPYETDIMYYQETDNIYLSQRDINTLARLYANPSYGD